MADPVQHIISSVFSEGVEQADGRRYVTEVHEADDGQSYTYEYLSDGLLDHNLILTERAKVINNKLEARAAAKAAVIGTSVPLTRYEFLGRFTSAERVAIRDIAKTDPIVEDFMEMMKLSGNVSLILARPGLDYLVSIGKLTPSRAAEIGAE